MLGAARDRVRRHPRAVDGAAATPLFVLSFVGGFATEPYGGSWWQALLVAGGICGPVVIRRPRPALAFAIAAAAAFVQWLLNLGLLPADIALFAALYNVASRCRWELAALGTAVLEFGAVLAIARWFVPLVGPQAWTQLIPSTILIGSMWIWGNSVRTRRAYLASLEERAVRLERERDNQAQIAAAAERARIARELHDVVSHSLSVMIVQADGAAYALDTDPGRAGQALERISSTGRGALSEMRRMLGVLRDGEDRPGQPDQDVQEDQREYAPQPGVAQLDQLVADVRRTGLPVELAVEGVPQELPAGMEVAAYRVVQEALTNTLKHGGPVVSCARVLLRYGGDVLEMRIFDDGRGAAAPQAPPDGSADGSVDGSADGSADGHGLIGMRERVAVFGGSVRAGPHTGGGYEVVASLPLQPATA